MLTPTALTNDALLGEDDPRPDTQESVDDHRVSGGSVRSEPATLL
jgi:hypothetical protein